MKKATFTAMAPSATESFKQELSELVEAYNNSASGYINQRRWFKCRPIEIYIRIERRLFSVPARPDTYRPPLRVVLTIANVSTVPGYTGRGFFSEVLRIIGEVWPSHIFVENVQTKRFADGLARRGFVIVRQGGADNTVDMVRMRENPRE